ncbi:MAG: hypothetical protein M3Q66_05015 [Chloroflexota bacterium]|nr:hypothetical protein [Chloroflexota bacterium]
MAVTLAGVTDHSFNSTEIGPPAAVDAATDAATEAAGLGVAAAAQADNTTTRLVATARNETERGFIVILQP